MRGGTDHSSGLGHLSVSSIDMFLRCPNQWYYRYVLGLKSPPVGAMITGSAAHSAVEFALQTKMDTKCLPDREDVLSSYSDSFDGMSTAQEVVFDAPVGNYKDMGVRALASHYTLLLDMRPTALEVEIRLPIPSLSMDLLGYVDVVEGNSIRDHKFTGRKKTQAQADNSGQLSTYLWALREKSGVDPDDPTRFVSASLEVSTFSGSSTRLETHRTPQQIFGYVEGVLIPAARQIVSAYKSGDFPCKTDGWHCSEKFCGYWHRCPMGSRYHSGFAT